MGLTPSVHRWPGCACDPHNTTGACDAEPVVCVCETPVPGDVDGIECATCRRPIRERMRSPAKGTGAPDVDDAPARAS